jgi:hypothetical protein
MTTNPSAPTAAQSQRAVLDSAHVGDIKGAFGTIGQRPSRQISTYSAPEVRTTVFAFLAAPRANVPATRFASSREVHAITRSLRAIPASTSSRPLTALAGAVATS